MIAVNKHVTRWLLPAVALILLWWLLSKGAAASWVIGLPCILFALFVFDRHRDRRGPNLRPWLLPGFTLWFLWNSLRGGVDVAWRALQPRMPLRPGFVRYRLSLPDGNTRVFLVNCISLMPGSLSADIDGDELVLHALDTGSDLLAEVRDTEHRVQRLYGIRVEAARG